MHPPSVTYCVHIWNTICTSVEGIDTESEEFQRSNCGDNDDNNNNNYN